MAAHSADTLQASVGMVRLRLPDRFLPCGLGLYCQRSNPSPHRVAIGSRVSGQTGTGIKGLLSLTIDRLEGFEFSSEFVH